MGGKDATGKGNWGDISEVLIIFYFWLERHDSLKFVSFLCIKPNVYVFHKLLKTCSFS